MICMMCVHTEGIDCLKNNIFFSVAVSLLRPSNYLKRSNGRYRLNMGKSYVTEDESINYETMLRDNRRNG